MKNDPPSTPSTPTRRSFLVTTGGTAVAAVVGACASTGAPDPVASSAPRGQDIEGAVPITLRVNGKDHEVRIDPRTTLLDCLREIMGLTGTKKGCDHWQCVACSVHLNRIHIIS